MWWIIPFTITLLLFMFPLNKNRNKEFVEQLVLAINYFLADSGEMILAIISWLIYCVLRICFGIV